MFSDLLICQLHPKLDLEYQSGCSCFCLWGTQHVSKLWSHLFFTESFFVDIIHMNLYSSLSDPWWTPCSNRIGFMWFLEYSMYLHTCMAWIMMLLQTGVLSSSILDILQGKAPVLLPSFNSVPCYFPLGLKCCLLHYFMWPVTKALISFDFVLSSSPRGRLIED